MWSASIVSKQQDKGQVFFGVEFTDGTQLFSESMDVTGQVFESVQSRIQGRLMILNANDKLVGTVGDVAQTAVAVELPVAEEPPTEIEPK